ncbi:MAG: hypothetical protein ACRD1I_06140, partial [Terriglobia bacterium]
ILLEQVAEKRGAAGLSRQPALRLFDLWRRKVATTPLTRGFSATSKGWRVPKRRKGKLSYEDSSA